MHVFQINALSLVFCKNTLNNAISILRECNGNSGTSYRIGNNTKANAKRIRFCLSLIFYFSLAADVLVVGRAGWTRKMAKTVGRACAQIAILLTIFGSIQCAKPICKCENSKT